MEYDFNNYKGIFHDDKQEEHYQDKVTGAHFDYYDMCRRLKNLQRTLSSKKIEKFMKETTIELGRNKIKGFGTHLDLQSSNFNLAPRQIDNKKSEGTLRSKSTDKPKENSMVQQKVRERKCFNL